MHWGPKMIADAVSKFGDTRPTNYPSFKKKRTCVYPDCRWKFKSKVFRVMVIAFSYRWTSQFTAQTSTAGVGQLVEYENIV